MMWTPRVKPIWVRAGSSSAGASAAAARDVNAAPTLTVALDPITGGGACPHGRNGRNSFPTLPVDQAAGDSTGPDRVVVVCIAAPLVLPLPLLLSWLDQHSSLEEERA